MVCVEAVGQGGRQGPVEEAYGLPEGDCACRSSPPRAPRDARIRGPYFKGTLLKTRPSTHSLFAPMPSDSSIYIIAKFFIGSG
jgi:hypothetical protein